MSKVWTQTYSQIWQCIRSYAYGKDQIYALPEVRKNVLAEKSIEQGIIEIQYAEKVKNERERLSSFPFKESFMKKLLAFLTDICILFPPFVFDWCQTTLAMGGFWVRQYAAYLPKYLSRRPWKALP